MCKQFLYAEVMPGQPAPGACNKPIPALLRKMDFFRTSGSRPTGTITGGLVK